MNGHYLKLYFCMFERSQVKHNSLDYHNFLWEYFSLIVKFTCSMFDTNNKKLHVQSTQTLKMKLIFFPNVIFFYQMCTIPSLNWRGF